MYQLSEPHILCVQDGIITAFTLVKNDWEDPVKDEEEEGQESLGLLDCSVDLTARERERM